MNELLRSENAALRRQLDALLHEARQNEIKQRRFDQLERQLIGSRSLAELFQLLLTEYRTAFYIDAISLMLLDPEYEVARILDDDMPQGLRLFSDISILNGLYAGMPEVRMCPYASVADRDIFGEDSIRIESVALLPLFCCGKLVGSLNLGSIDPHRYEAGSGSSFLERFAAVAAVCIENTLAHERLKTAGMTDALTGVHNRRYFDHRSEVEVSQALRHHQSLCCMFLDIDHFKRINDTHGHQTGDVVLRNVSGIIRAQLRTGDTIARYGGEEFVVLLPQTSIVHAREIAERIRRAVEAGRQHSLSGGTVPVTISIGLAKLAEEDLFDLSGQTAAMISAADKALYAAKQNGRNRVVDRVEPLQPVTEKHRQARRGLFLAYNVFTEHMGDRLRQFQRA